jgi:hypothetical protein
MNKEQQELLDEVYENYRQKIISEDLWMLVAIGWPSTQEEFINKCKTDTEFSERWGLKIDERELNYEERIKLFKEKTNRSLTYTLNVRERLDENGIPTKLITITYNDKTIESYENNS